ncbi:SMP-30/gluconolactonase/LRE family protein [Glaciimonas immobilis]|uniref:Gluconolactonase n=1 Tax=Glaciimonas immobilis TaxID=728004 RepID=A0A840RTP9_9BURK|nr:SMP-30/gluconolactonase/LRE family protein [Glaciimonas immobilis]KAF3996602.1 SMP-30/gluconolactonase/LRE family protein [Glaciimonas immobilis]MBB5201023.1 gluconolactonase [Glaciimonas immobilis]
MKNDKKNNCVDAGRRVALLSGLAAATTALTAGAQSVDFKINSRYPDSSVQVLDPSFLKYRLYSSTVEQLATGFRWMEGPVWFGDGRFLLFSDIPNNRIMRWDEVTGATSVFRNPSNFSNGMARDRQGRLLTCEHLTRRVTRTEYDGRITVLADGYNGKRFNSPNDIVCKSDGSVWFTDPPFGIGTEWEGDKATAELPHSVYRIDGPSNKLTLINDTLAGPNGLAFSPDEKLLYIVESRATPSRKIWAYQVMDGGQKLGARTLVIDANGPGSIDGFKVDMDGNLWVGWGSDGRLGVNPADLDGVMVFNPQGKPIAHIHLPERCTNLAFGGAKKNRLLMASSHSLYALYVETRGAV